jgi:hypothetical protein
MLPAGLPFLMLRRTLLLFGAGFLCHNDIENSVLRGTSAACQIRQRVAAKNSKKMSILGLTIGFRLVFSMSRLKRGSACTELVLRIFWDCKLELNFVPVYHVSPSGTDLDRTTGLSFFVA